MKLEFKDVTQITRRKQMGFFNTGIFVVALNKETSQVEKYIFGSFQDRELTFKRLLALWMSRAPEENWRSNKSQESFDGTSSRAASVKPISRHNLHSHNGAVVKSGSDQDDRGSPQCDSNSGSGVLQTAISQESDDANHHRGGAHTDNEMLQPKKFSLKVQPGQVSEKQPNPEACKKVEPKVLAEHDGDGNESQRAEEVGT